MAHLFAEAFAEPLLDPTGDAIEHRYDEALGLSVLRDGRVFVEHADFGQTQTGTKATGEHDDEDPVEPTSTDVKAALKMADSTHTAVKAEADDWTLARVGSETVTKVKAETDDWSISTGLDTHTRVRGEADDWA